MKAITTLLIICLVGCITACQGQTTKESSEKETLKTTGEKDSSKQMNLLDEQVKMYGSVFELAGAGEDNPLSQAENYGELIEKMDLPEEQKVTQREHYKVYDLSLDPTKKDSLKIMVGKMLENAMEKSQTDPDN
ncbi:hypothetical protein [Maribacter halichondriae]|uniref:hypothetical protein n=1 Tax=Maribacter halichondriae TaxID=2980554 RepID=UPI002359DF2F|nr:hypothetical protein [Maribacter sp. Hal144]